MLVSFAAAALQCGVRDEWIGWAFRHQFARLNLVANNSRFLILPQGPYPNVASQGLSLCRQRIQQDWRDRFGFPLLLLETLGDPTRYQGRIYQATNWRFLGLTKGYARTRTGYRHPAHAQEGLRPASATQYARIAVSPRVTSSVSNRSASDAMNGCPHARSA